MTTPAVDTHGYMVVSLSRVGQRENRITRTVHRIVAEAFLQPTFFSGAQVNHKNGCKTDNAVENLEWVSCIENIHHAIEHLGRDFKGEASANAKLTEDDVLKIRERAIAGETFKSIAADFGVSNVNIANVATGKTWTNVGGPLVKKRDAAEKKRLGIPNHAPDVRSNRQRR